MSNDLEGIKVLVIYDSKTVRSSSEWLLKKSCCSVVTAEDCFDALSIIVRENSDIIFIDVMMPRLDGYETCSIIRGNEQYREMPIVMLSSKSSFCDKAKGDVVGANAYLPKPFSRDELFDAIRKFAGVQQETPMAVA